MNGNRRVPRAVTVTVGLVALVISVWVVVTSALFDIQRIDVRGVRRLSPEEVVNLSGARVGKNLLTLSLEGVERSVLRSPWVSSARATRSLPSTLVIRIIERSPVAWVQDPGGYASLAGDGTVLARGVSTPRGLVSLGTSTAEIPVGGRSRGLEAPLRVAASLAPALRRAVEEARVVGDEVELVLIGGPRVLYGAVESLSEKNAALASMLRYARRNEIDIEYLDVRTPAAPALMPAGAG